MKPKSKSCGTCKHLGVKPDQDGKIRVRADSLYPCICPGKFVMTGLVPSCFVITSRRKLMGKDEGSDCVKWESRK